MFRTYCFVESYCDRVILAFKNLVMDVASRPGASIEGLQNTLDGQLYRGTLTRGPDDGIGREGLSFMLSNVRRLLQFDSLEMPFSPLCVSPLVTHCS